MLRTTGRHYKSQEEEDREDMFCFRQFEDWFSTTFEPLMFKFLTGKHSSLAGLLKSEKSSHQRHTELSEGSGRGCSLAPSGENQ